MGGSDYLEKADYVVKKLNEKQKALAKENEGLSKKNNELKEKIEDTESLIKEVSEIAYDKAREVLTYEITEKVTKEHMDIIESYKKWVSSPERTAPEEVREYAVKRLDFVQNKIKDCAKKMISKLKTAFGKSETKQVVVEKIVKAARPTLKDKLERNIKIVEEEKQKRQQQFSSFSRKKNEVSL